MARANVDTSIVVENPEGISYQSIGGAILPCDLESGQLTGGAVAIADSHAGDDQSEKNAEIFRRAAPVPAPRQAARVPAPTPLVLTGSPNQIVRAAKARIKELTAFLRAAKKAEKELNELKRLVAAAKRPLAPVRDIRRSG